MKCSRQAAWRWLWLAAVAGVLLGAVVSFVYGRLGLSSRRIEANLLGIAAATLFGLVGIPEGRSSGEAPGPWTRVGCSVALASVTGVILSAPWLQYGSKGIHGCERLVSVVRADTPSWLSTAYYFADGSSSFLLALMAIACIMSRHPPSPYARVTVWAVVGIWMEMVSWAAVNKMWCKAEHGGAVLSIFVCFRACAQVLDDLTLGWVVLLVWQRTMALQASFGASLGTRLISWVVAWIVFFGFVSGYVVFSQIDIFPLPDISKKGSNVLFSAVKAIQAALMLIDGVLIGRAFSIPLRILRFEAEKVKGAPRAEAEWAARRLRLERAAAVFTSLVSVAKLTAQAVRPFFYHLSFDLLWYADDLVNALSVAILSGLLWQEAPPKVTAPASDLLRRSLTETSQERDMLARMLRTSSSSSPDASCAEWDAKVGELAGRGFSADALLSFCELLLRREVMPSYDPERSTTNDVSRQAIIPLSYINGKGQALATVWSQGEPVMAARMVSHSWNNKFAHLAGAVVADGLGHGTYEGAAAQIATLEGIQQLRRELGERGTLNRTYWICALSINQHASICGGFGAVPPRDSPLHAEWLRKRHDTVSGEPFRVCPCCTRKYMNSEPVPCEMNKFDDMLRYLYDNLQDFQLVAAVDARFDLFSRAWCVAEIVQAFGSGIPISMRISSEDDLDLYYNELSLLDMRRCQASRKEDKDMILARILDIDVFNNCLQWLIFGSEGLFNKWFDANGRVGQAGRIARRALRRPPDAAKAICGESSDAEEGERHRARFGSGANVGSGSRMWLDARERAAAAGRVARDALRRLRLLDLQEASSEADGSTVENLVSSSDADESDSQSSASEDSSDLDAVDV